VCRVITVAGGRFPACGTLAGTAPLRYILVVPPSSLTPDEIRASAAAHHELGPEYQGAVVESFLDKIGKELDARMDARLAGGYRMAPAAPPRPARAPRGEPSPFWLAVVSLAMSIPLTAIVVAAGALPPAGRILGLLVIWAAIAVVNWSYSRRNPQR
jgi:hypothetical protein